MTEHEFKQLAAQGYNRIPLSLETLADLDTPLSVYLKLANRPYSYLLESVVGGERFGRYSFIGLASSTLGLLRSPSQGLLAGIVLLGTPFLIRHGASQYADVPLSFFFLATLAEVNRAPFDMPEAEQELTAGYHTEYSGMKFALFFMAEYMKMVAVSGIGVALFFGGYLGPFLDTVGPWVINGWAVGSWIAGLLGLLYFSLKTAFFLFFMIWIRGTLPRLRYDQLMRLGWKVMLPLALANVVVTAVALALLGARG